MPAKQFPIMIDKNERTPLYEIIKSEKCPNPECRCDLSEVGMRYVTKITGDVYLEPVFAGGGWTLDFEQDEPDTMDGTLIACKECEEVIIEIH